MNGSGPESRVPERHSNAAFGCALVAPAVRVDAYNVPLRENTFVNSIRINSTSKTAPRPPLGA